MHSKTDIKLQAQNIQASALMHQFQSKLSFKSIQSLLTFTCWPSACLHLQSWDAQAKIELCMHTKIHARRRLRWSKQTTIAINTIRTSYSFSSFLRLQKLSFPYDISQVWDSILCTYWNLCSNSVVILPQVITDNAEDWHVYKIPPCASSRQWAIEK